VWVPNWSSTSCDLSVFVKLLFAAMIRAADRWRRVLISDRERHQLTLLRAEPGLDPPPANTDHRKTNQHKDIAV
jgi:hypothetical protein